MLLKLCPNSKSLNPESSWESCGSPLCPLCACPRAPVPLPPEKTRSGTDWFESKANICSDTLLSCASLPGLASEQWLKVGVSCGLKSNPYSVGLPRYKNLSLQGYLILQQGRGITLCALLIQIFGPELRKCFVSEDCMDSVMAHLLTSCVNLHKFSEQSVTLIRHGRFVPGGIARTRSTWESTVKNLYINIRCLYINIS